MQPELAPTIETPRRRSYSGWVLDILLIVVLLGGAFFRFNGLAWDEYTWMHPDERFMVWVTSDIAPVERLADYFNTQTSSLNPHNRNHGFFVYGTFPLFLTRYLVTWLHQTPGWEEIAQVGRPLSALFDLLTVFLVYLLAARLYDRRVGLLGAAFLALAVLPIQLSHFYKEDTFLNFFTLLAVYFAVRIAAARMPQPPPAGEGDDPQAPPAWPSAFAGLGLQFAGFGLALGLAAACKLNAVPVAIVLPGAVALRLLALPGRERERQAWSGLGCLVLAAVVSLLVFRVFQPYAFSGPGFLGITPNPRWVDNIVEQRNQAAGDVDFPPSLQWARRPLWFAWQNIVGWGLGLPLGLLATAGFLWIGWRIFQGEWRQHILLWGWAGFYFAWQSSQFNPTMRYLLPVYPLLAIFAAWALVRLWDDGRRRAAGGRLDWLLNLRRPAAGLLALVVLGATLIYALAFYRVHTSPFTRSEASRWIYENIPGPINLHIQTETGAENQIISFPYDYAIRTDLPYVTTFQPKAAGALEQIYLPHVEDPAAGPLSGEFLVQAAADAERQNVLAVGAARVEINAPAGEAAEGRYTFQFDRPVVVVGGQTVYLALYPPPAFASAGLSGGLELSVETGAEAISQSLALGSLDPASRSYRLEFPAPADGFIRAVSLSMTIQRPAIAGEKMLLIRLGSQPDGSDILASASVVDTFASASAGGGFLLTLDRPVRLDPGQSYTLWLSLQGASGSLTLKGAAVANEGDWDDGLPLRMEGYDGFGGIYQRDLNFNMYWDDNPEKLARFTRILGQAEYLLISSNRQWGVLPRLAERFPLVTTYYRYLLGCPQERSISWCYNVAQPGMFSGSLGFELVQVFQSNPRLGPLEINDQFAEEAFTVYDHPKVFIFRKTEAYNPTLVSAILGAVDFERVIRVTPKRASARPMDLALPAERLAEQQAGGTWAALFPPENPLNRWQPLGVLAWYLLISLLGLAAYPLTRLALPGLADRGYPLARIVGLLLLAYLAWLAGSLRIPYERPLIALALLLIVAAGVFLAYRQRESLRAEWQANRGYFLRVEVLALAAFLLVLLIRWGNPDLWHPWKGGEKPMDFSYFNAVLKSTSFPPYDPWFAGGYINYYYYGFVIVGTPVKLLGLEPAFAYNLILPAVFSLIALGAFSLGWNFTRRKEAEGQAPAGWTPYIVALAAAAGVALLGNLGTLRMIYRGAQVLAAPGGTIESAGLFTRLGWAAQGLVKLAAGNQLPYGIADWYWNPSRAIAALGDVEPITEFPFFTVLYADLHAHLIALPITLLALGWALSCLLGRGGWRSLGQGLLGFFIGGLAIGALRPTNTWDLPTYLALGMIAAFYAAARAGEPPRFRLLAGLSPGGRRSLAALGGPVLLAALSLLLYQPYAYWYGQGYNAVDLWQGARTPLIDYFTHWGLFLFVIVAWMAAETIDWMAVTPVSALRRLEPYRQLIWGGLILLISLILALGLRLPGMEDLPFGKGIQVAWLALPLAAWAGILLLRPGIDDARRAALFLVGTGLALTLVVEVIVLRGDIGRMNTVFKFYLQVWTLFAVCAAAAGGWLLNDLPRWAPSLRSAWLAVLTMLVAAAALYPLTGAVSKVKDRIAETAPRTLDGMAYMQYATYHDQGGPMDLSQDYRAIRWMQANVSGSPVIVEGNTPEYRWGSRFTINTGLPGVVGWNWHQRQQRGTIVPADWVTDRIGEVAQFYLTSESEEARAFLRKYDAAYIVVGQLERAYYPGPGLEKFPALEGVLWRLAYQDLGTAIYEVIRE